MNKNSEVYEENDVIIFHYFVVFFLESTNIFHFNKNMVGEVSKTFKSKRNIIYLARQYYKFKNFLSILYMFI